LLNRTSPPNADVCVQEPTVSVSVPSPVSCPPFQTTGPAPVPSKSMESDGPGKRSGTSPFVRQLDFALANPPAAAAHTNVSAQAIHGSIATTIAAQRRAGPERWYAPAKPCIRSCLRVLMKSFQRQCPRSLIVLTFFLMLKKCSTLVNDRLAMLRPGFAEPALPHFTPASAQDMQIQYRSMLTVRFSPLASL